METITYEGIDDRSGWGAGPWDNESTDKLQWRSTLSGVPCLIVRGPLGGWCGYAGVEDLEHPWFEKDYDDVKPYPDVHGGLTFADFCQENEHGICHIVEEGETERVWWLGFDTGHLMDQLPALTIRDGGVYRTQSYVVAEVEGLAQQLKAAA